MSIREENPTVALRSPWIGKIEGEYESFPVICPIGFGILGITFTINIDFFIYKNSYILYKGFYF